MKLILSTQEKVHLLSDCMIILIVAMSCILKMLDNVATKSMSGFTSVTSYKTRGKIMVYGVEHHFQQYFSYIMVVSFIRNF